MLMNLNFSTGRSNQINLLFILTSTEMFCLRPNARLKSKEVFFNEPSDIKKKLLSSDMFTISSVCDFAYVPCLLGMLFFSGGTIED